MVELLIKRISDKVSLPQFAHDGDMCFDIPVIVDGDNKPAIVDGDIQEKTYLNLQTDVTGRKYVILQPNQSAVFHTGLKMETEKGYGLKVHVRSSTGIKKKLVLSNATGIIDTYQYRGELLVSLTNIGPVGRKVYDLERIAQGEVVEVLNVTIKEVDTLSDTARGEGGIGSTGGH